MTFKPWLWLGIFGASSGYELQSDVATRTAEAKQELGSNVTVEAVEGVFLLVSPRGQSSSAVSVTKNVLRAYFNGRFAKRPERAVSVYLFPDAKPYERYCQSRWSQSCGSPYGFYRPDERRIVMNAGPGIGTLTHELVHPIMETDFPEAPEWLNEGVASLFEAFSMPAPGEVHGVKNWRHPRLVRALRSPAEQREAGLPALFAIITRPTRRALEPSRPSWARAWPRRTTNGYAGSSGSKALSLSSLHAADGSATCSTAAEFVVP